MSTAEDDFEQVLTRCREQLTDITLTVPDLDEEGGDRVARFSLEEMTATHPNRSESADIVAASEPTVSSEPIVSVAMDPEEPRTESVMEDVPALADMERTSLEPPPQVNQESPSPKSLPAARRRAQKAGDRNLRFAVSLFVALAAAGLAAYRLTRDQGNSLQIPLGSSATALAHSFDLGEFYVAQGGEVLTFTRAGALLRRKKIDGELAALRWNQGALWSVDGKSSNVVERRGARPTIYTLNHVPNTLFLNDRFLWTGERSSRTLRQFMLSRSILGAMLQPIDRVDLPSNIDLLTFSFDPGGDLYVVDNSQYRLIRFRLNGGTYRPFLSAPLSPILGPDESLHRLYLERGSLWALSNPENGRSALKRIPFSSLHWNSTQ